MNTVRMNIQGILCQLYCTTCSVDNVFTTALYLISYMVQMKRNLLNDYFCYVINYNVNQ